MCRSAERMSTIIRVGRGHVLVYIRLNIPTNGLWGGGDEEENE
jgi:hypothetical protein